MSKELATSISETSILKDPEKSENSIDQAIGTCERKIREHRFAGNRFLIMIALILCFFAGYEVMKYLQTIFLK